MLKQPVGLPLIYKTIHNLFVLFLNILNSNVAQFYRSNEFIFIYHCRIDIVVIFKIINM